jgi:hypothetical protein
VSGSQRTRPVMVLQRADHSWRCWPRFAAESEARNSGVSGSSLDLGRLLRAQEKPREGTSSQSDDHRISSIHCSGLAEVRIRDFSSTSSESATVLGYCFGNGLEDTSAIR